MHDNEKEKTSVGMIIAAVLLIAVFALLIVFFASKIIKNSFGKLIDEETESVSESDTEGTAQRLEQESETESINTNINYTVIEADTEDIYKGDLILVNSDHKCHFYGSETFLPIYGNKTQSYQISGSAILIAPHVLDALNTMLDDFYDDTDISDVLVKSAYRSYDEQQQIYDRCYDTYGEDAVKYVSRPGHSDHNTGLSADLSVYAKDGVIYDLDYSEAYAPIFENCYKYGFVLRFPSEKSTITGISTDLFHFRYVSVPHSYIMKQNNLCLEEYFDFIKQYPFNDTHYLAITDYGKYEVYYVPADMSLETQSIPVPQDYEYVISGNNADGFVVWYSLSSRKAS